jgi:hypothetical protein
MLESRKRYEAGVVEEVGWIGIHWHWFRVAKGLVMFKFELSLGTCHPAAYLVLGTVGRLVDSDDSLLL